MHNKKIKNNDAYFYYASSSYFIIYFMLNSFTKSSYVFLESKLFFTII